MKTLAIAISIGFASLAVADVDGIYDPALPNEDAYELVRQGIESAPDRTVSALAQVVMFERAREFGIETWLVAETGQGSVPLRDYGRVAELKEFLLRYWRENHAASGYNADYAGGGGDDWKSVPMILCRLFPGDPDVHTLVWDIAASDVTPAPSLRQMTLQWLNVGQFMTPEADAYRLSVLTSGDDSARAYVNVGYAAKGLALARRPESLGAIIEAWNRYPIAEADIAPAVASYPDNLLLLHADQLRDAVGGENAHWRKFGSEAVQQAMMRLQAVAIGEH